MITNYPRRNLIQQRFIGEIFIAVADTGTMLVVATVRLNPETF